MNKPKILQIHEDHLEDVRFSSRVAGSTFYDPSQQILKILKDNVPQDPNHIILMFEREPDNEVDENAVEVYVTIPNAKKRYKLGHIPKDGAPIISYVLLHKDEYTIKIDRVSLSGGDVNRECIGLFFDFRILRNNKR